MKLHFLLNAVFQSNPKYALIEWDSLHQPEQEVLAGSSINSADIFGVFKPLAPQEGLSMKLAYKEVALLFYFLQQPGKLPNYIRAGYDDDMNMMLAKLVMEGVIQIESNGDFLSGTLAFKQLYEDNGHRQSWKYIETLSSKAIEYVVQLNYLDLGAALTRLYSYNTIPPPLKNSAFNAPDETESFSDGENGPQTERELLKHWIRHSPTKEFPWLMYTRDLNGYNRTKNNVTYKMYVSPLPSSLREVYEKTIMLLSSTKAFSFKTGINQDGMLRPDKFVIYFHEYEHLHEAAALLNTQLKEYPVQGVPFTAQLDDTGLLSYGIDPPGNNKLDSQGGSWRAHVAEKLAVAVLQAKEAQLDAKDAYEYIINKIYLEQIDPHTWVPQQDIWK